MKHKEADFSLIFRHYLRANPMPTASFELKDTRGKSSFLMSELSENQIGYARAIEGNKGVLMRTPAIAEGTPDYIYLRNTPAHIAIKYPTFFVIIPIRTFIFEKTRSKRRSLTAERAKEIAHITVHLTNNVR